MSVDQRKHFAPDQGAPPARAYPPGPVDNEGAITRWEPAAMNEERRLILILDDDWAVRNSLKFALELEGLEVRLFNIGADLLADPNLEEAGCVVLDHDMRALGDFDVLRRLTARERPIPIILMADHATDALCRKATALGVRHVVEKPLLNGALIESIREVLGVERKLSPT